MDFEILTFLISIIALGVAIIDYELIRNQRK